MARSRRPAMSSTPPVSAHASPSPCRSSLASHSRRAASQVSTARSSPVPAFDMTAPAHMAAYAWVVSAASPFTAIAASRTRTPSAPLPDSQKVHAMPPARAKARSGSLLADQPAQGAPDVVEIAVRSSVTHAHLVVPAHRVDTPLTELEVELGVAAPRVGSVLTCGEALAPEERQRL